MSGKQLFTIGHSNRTIDEFVSLLQGNGVTAIADVRSSPYSRHSPQFNREPLKISLRQNQIAYVFLGDELGARRIEPDCYINGAADYDLIARTDAFLNGLDRIRSGVVSHRIALLCAEKDPLVCHRTILVCRHLKDELRISHIVDQGEIEDHATAELRLLDLVDLPSKHLFQTQDELIDEAYDKQGKRIAYRDESQTLPTSTQNE